MSSAATINSWVTLAFLIFLLVGSLLLRFRRQRVSLTTNTQFSQGKITVSCSLPGGGMLFRVSLGDCEVALFAAPGCGSSVLLLPPGEGDVAENRAGAAS